MRELGPQPTVVYRVSELVGDLRAVCAESFGRVWIEGEVRELHRSRAGHVYFALEDEGALLRAVLFRRAAERSEVPLEEGLRVRVFAQIDVYPERGQLQLVVDRVLASGEGALRIAFERLKRRLHDEGLFDPAHKRALPHAPSRIGLVTSLGGAAIHDFLRALRRRCAALDVVVYDVRVQGEDAWREVVQGLHLLASQEDLEVLVVTRGGGSLQDLWTFNREELVRAIFELDTPVISAIGHETDQVLTDWVADARAATPTAAAELVCPDAETLRLRLMALAEGLVRTQRLRTHSLALRLRGLERGLVDPRERLRACRRRLDAARGALLRGVPRRLVGLESRLGIARRHLASALDGPLSSYASRRDRAARTLDRAVDRSGARARARLEALGSRLDALSPLGVLARGYSIARRDADGVILRASSQVAVGDAVSLTLGEGSVRASITGTLAAGGVAGEGDGQAGDGPERPVRGRRE